MTDEKYNGWTNYETWLVKLWIDNDQGSQEYWLEEARESVKNAVADYGTKADAARYSLAGSLKDWHQEQADEITGVTGMFKDLLTAALGSVNWNEIAANFLDEYTEILETT